MADHPREITCPCGKPAYHHGDYKGIPIICIYRCEDNHVTEQKLVVEDEIQTVKTNEICITITTADQLEIAIKQALEIVQGVESAMDIMRQYAELPHLATALKMAHTYLQQTSAQLDLAHYLAKEK